MRVKSSTGHERPRNSRVQTNPIFRITFECYNTKLWNADIHVAFLKNPYIMKRTITITSKQWESIQERPRRQPVPNAHKFVTKKEWKLTHETQKLFFFVRILILDDLCFSFPVFLFVFFGFVFNFCLSFLLSIG